jgi:protoporphyrinogen oxidase
VRVARLSEPKGYRSSRSDPADRSVLCAEVPATVGDDVWSAGDDELARLVRADLLAVGLPDPTPTSVHVERRSHVYPVYRLGFEEQQRTVQRWLDRLPGVVALGRQALFAHDNTHHAMAMGRAIADCLDDDGRVDRAVWAAASARFADHVVED